MSNLARKRTPEEDELKQKKAELKKLEAKLARNELKLATLQAELHVFEAKYVRIVGELYWELDDIEARIAEANARLHPEVVEVVRKAAEARARANETAEAVGKAKKSKQAKEKEETEFKPSEDLKKLYRELAKKIHPDLAIDDEEGELRNKFMADVNKAYEEGDADRLRAILVEWETSPHAVRGEGIEAQLDRICRKIEKANRRLVEIQKTLLKLQESELYILSVKVEKATKLGRDLLSDMAKRVRDDIKEAKQHLEMIEKQSVTNEQ